MLSLESTVVIINEQVSCDLAGEAVILSLKDGVYYGLDPVGARIWSLIHEPKTVGEVRDAITKEYDVEPEQCERDILELFQQLWDNGLIRL